MAKINANIKESVFSINGWLGVNESTSGDTHLKMGEAAHSMNFKITDDYALQKRPGTKQVAGLLSAYSITVASTATTIATETNTTTNSYLAYPTISVSAGGILTLSGTAVTVNYANISTYVGYYTTINGTIYQIGTCTLTRPSTGTLVNGGSVNIETVEHFIENTVEDSPIRIYESITVSSGSVNLTGAYITGYVPDSTHVYIYDPYSNSIAQITRTEFWVETLYGYHLYGHYISFAGNDSYTWAFKLVTATSAASDKNVCGIWSGNVNGAEYIIAACNGFLWSLSEASGVWTKTSIGAVTTSNGHVHMFGFNKKLYILDGTNYKSWDGTTLLSVVGYRPLVSISNVPSGGGTSLEQVNKLNGTRRAQFSPDGSATTFQLPETGLTSIDYVKKTSDGTAVTFTANTVTGVVTITPALVAGTNSIEIGYAVPTNCRSQITAMKYSETFNGETDTRIFLYGDGTNTAYYSGLDSDGNPSAEYFPDLNVMAVDSANTPITGMIKHFSSLLTYKTDGAFITNYGTITLTDGTVTAGFYTTPLNRQIGNVALGQIKLVKNNPLTLYGRSVYEWLLSSYASKDERIAKAKSDRVRQTLATFTLSSAICFDDEFHSEYYVVQNGIAVVYNYKADVWYIYNAFPATCMITYKQELYYGDANGNILHFSRDYMNDCGSAIQCYWESGSMSFGADYKLKYSPNLWVGLKPEESSEIYVTVDTDRATDYSEEDIVAQYTDSVASGFFNFLNLDFTKLSFGVNSNPQMNTIKIKVKKFVYYKLIFSTSTVNTTATVTAADIRVRYTGNVR